MKLRETGKCQDWNDLREHLTSALWCEPDESDLWKSFSKASLLDGEWKNLVCKSDDMVVN